MFKGVAVIWLIIRGKECVSGAGTGTGRMAHYAVGQHFRCHSILRSVTDTVWPEADSLEKMI